MSKVIRLSEQNLEILKKYHEQPDIALSMVLKQIEIKNEDFNTIYSVVIELQDSIKVLDVQNKTINNNLKLIDEKLNRLLSVPPHILDSELIKEHTKT